MTTPKDLDAFFERQIQLLQEEKQVEIDQSSLLLTKCSLKLLEQRGLALLNLVPLNNVRVGMGGRNLIELGRSAALSTSASLPPHTFRPGDIARIEKSLSKSSKKEPSARSDTSKENSLEGVVYKVTDSLIVLAVDGDRQANEDLDLPNICSLIKLANNVPNDRMQKVILSLYATFSSEAAAKNTKLALHPDTISVANVLLGISAPSKVVPVDGVDFYDVSLNDSQKQAVRFALGSREVACIHGPPGTGKTHTLLEIIRQFLFPRCAPGPSSSQGPVKRILVCGASNLSVDNILERLLLPPLPGMTSIKCTRVGHPARVKGQASSLEATLDAQTTRCEQAELINDIKDELSKSLLCVAGKGKGQKGKKPRGEERRKLWDEIKELRKECRKREKGVVSSVLSEAQVVLATCHSAGGRTLENMFFDVVIIDEATQALEAACWIPIVKGKRLILAGDHLQLPPTVLSQTKSPMSSTKQEKATRSASAPSGVKESGNKRSTKAGEVDSLTDSSDDSESNSPLPNDPKVPEKDKPNTASGRVLRPSKDLSITLFERLEKTYGKSIKRMLEIQYRMHSKICEFPSKMLYNSQLRPDESVASHLLQDLENAGDDSSELLTAPVVFLDTSGSEYYERTVEDVDDGSKYNENEAMLVKVWLAKLIGAGIYPSQIAIITPYQAQVSHISALLSDEYKDELEIGTVDGMQGREKEAIIISLVRSNDKREVGFLKDKRRLNVAMTRARRHLCVIGDSSTVQHGGKFLKAWMAWLENNAEVYYGGLEQLP
ncbi:P-loop containing nucleoside triphosphate hydrolase protein [Fomitiporia mediterranea MF3/22]|uniref:P-loop containing nucleoside triphosphate hydrolase protein n=1 Tax=Fomitiporia mediterranea (strain MF3/22) TaxID=694068 RepID=UPI0004408163|nr:P-loop containing nucleoside triphosphate hydrolase protein [Fomitiporia mediterranea MF3/22]EJD02064.1 P-loop containing nucleoside triphosphate hydrolase protein [Fomitiporia mediterranea MF3/22]